MGTHSIRTAFEAAADGKLRLVDAGLGYRNNRQYLAFTGWHSDDMPFAMVTPPFDGNPNERAAQVARDLVQIHSAGASGVHPVEGGSATTAPSRAIAGPSQLRSTDSMSQKGSGLARLMGGLRTLDGDADVLAARLEAAMGALNTEMATTQQIVGNVENSVNDLKSVNALYSNGEPPTPTPPGSSGLSQS